MATISNSSTATATGSSNQRKLDRTINDNIHALFLDNDTIYIGISQNSGSTWSRNLVTVSGFAALAKNASFFIDADDYAHIIWKDLGSYNLTNGYIYYMRGTPNAGRTAWTWGAPFAIWTQTTGDYPDFIVYRDPAASGWKLEFVISVVASGNDRVVYNTITIASDGTPSLSFPLDLTSYGNTNHKYPSIDFNHTGDGKTVKDGLPHLYIAWSAGATGAGKGIRFKKLTYQVGTGLILGTEREIDSTRYLFVGNVFGVDHSDWLNCVFTGAEIVIGGCLYNGSDSKLVFYRRDIPDTTTTIEPVPPIYDIRWGSLSYDSMGNIYYSDGNRIYRWNRSTGYYDEDLGAVSTNGKYVSFKRGYSNNKMEFIYTDGISNPYAVTYTAVTLNTAPVVTLISPVAASKVDPRLPLTVEWSYVDSDSDPQAQWEIGYSLATAQSWTTFTGTNETSYIISGNTFVDESLYDIRVRVYDAADWSEYSLVTVTMDSWIYGPEVTSSVASANLDTTGFDGGDYEIQVRTADAESFGPWSLSATMTVIISNVMVYLAGSWTSAQRKIRQGGTWKDHNPQKLP